MSDQKPAPMEDEPCTLGQLCEIIQEHAKAHFLKFIHNANKCQRLDLGNLTQEQLTDFRGLIKILCGNLRILYGYFRKGTRVGDHLHLVRTLFNKTFHGNSTPRDEIKKQVESLLILLEEFELADARVALPLDSTVFARVVVAAHLKRLKIGDHSFGNVDEEDKQLMNNLIRDSKAKAPQPQPRPYRPPQQQQPPQHRPPQHQPFPYPAQPFPYGIKVGPPPAIKLPQLGFSAPPLADPPRPKQQQPKPQPKPKVKPPPPKPKVTAPPKPKQPQPKKKNNAQPLNNEKPLQNDPIFPDDDNLVHIDPGGAEVDEDGFPVYDPAMFGEDVRIDSGEGEENDDSGGDHHDDNDEDLEDAGFGDFQEYKANGNHRNEDYEHQDEHRWRDDGFEFERDRQFEEDRLFEGNRFGGDRPFEGRDYPFGGGGGDRPLGGRDHPFGGEDLQIEGNHNHLADEDNDRYQFEDDFNWEDPEQFSPKQPASPQPNEVVDDHAYQLNSMDDLCNQCRVKRVNCILEPCGEVMFCYDCAIKAKNSTGRCPICNGHIDAVDAFS